MIRDIIAGTSSTLSSNSSLPPALLTNLVAWWKMDETSGARANSVASSVGSIDGTGHTSTSGLINNEIVCNVANPCPYVPYDALLDLSGKDFSFSFWWTTPTLDPSYNTILRKLGSLTEQDFSFYRMASGQFAISAYTGSPIISDVGTGTASNIVANTRHHVVLTFNNTTKVFRFYTDNNNAGTITVTGQNVGNTASGALQLSGYSYLGSPVYADKYDEFGVWTNRELTAGEVSQLYNGGLGVTY